MKSKKWIRLSLSVLFIFVLVIPIIFWLTSYKNNLLNKKAMAQAACGYSYSDTILIIDDSYSMATGIPSKFITAKNEATSFVDIMSNNNANNLLSLVSFGHVATIEASLTNSWSNVKNKISALEMEVTSFGTCHECAIRKIDQEASANGRPGVKKAVVFLTDGKANIIEGVPGVLDPAIAQQAALTALNNMANDVVFYTIGLGADVDQAFLQQIADLTGGEYYFSPTSSDLGAIYTAISAIIGRGSINGFVFNDANGNAVYDLAEAKLSGWIVQLSAPGYNQIFTTSATGYYNITDLCDRNYQLIEIVQPGWVQTFPAGPSYNITITNGNKFVNKNFGNNLGYTIRGNVFDDVNKNKVKDGGEINYPAVPSITVNPAAGIIDALADGTYTISNLLAGTYTVSYAPVPVGYFMVWPQPANLRVTVGPPLCNVVDPTTGGSCTPGNNVTNLNFAISDSMPWIQTYGLDLRVDNGFENRQPASTICGEGSFASGTIPGSFDTPGIIFSGDGSADFGQGFASIRDWKVGGGSWPEVFESTKPLRTSAQSLLGAAAKAGIAIQTLSSCSNNCNLPAGVGFYHILGDWVSDKVETFNNGNHVFVSDGTITFTGNNKKINVGNNATVIFSAKQDIIIDPSYGAAADCSPLPVSQLQGIFSADRNIIVEGNNDCVVGADKMLNIEGSLIVNAARDGGVFDNNRDLCGGNSRWPSITIKARPDFILHTPGFMTEQNTISHEEVP